MKKLFVVVVACFMLFFVGCKSEPVEWLTNLEQANLKATETGKDILVLFTGFGWDGYSEEFCNNIMFQDKFLKTASKNFVPVHLNISTDTENFTEEDSTNYMIAYSLGIQSCPIVLAVSQDFIPYGSFSYATGTHDISTCISKVKELGENGNTLRKLKDDLEVSSGVEKANIIDKLYNLVPEEFSYQFEELIREFPILDSQNQTGKLGFYSLLCAYQDATLIFNQSGDFYSTANIFKDLADSGFLSPEEYQMAYYQAAFFESCMGNVPTENTLPYLKKAYEAAPNSEIADSLLITINNLEESGDAN